jgi:hypothetical protein
MPDQSIRRLTLHSAADLAVLAKPGMTREPALLQLDIPGIEPHALRRWEHLLNSRFNACGCKTGAVFALLALAGAITWQAHFESWQVPRWPMFALRAGLAMLIGTLVGKSVGIRLARWDLRRIAWRIQRQQQATFR